MKTTLLLATLLVAGALAALVPTADAEQLCTYKPSSQHCHSHLVCYYNRLTGEWDCYVDVYCLHRCWGPALP